MDINTVIIDNFLDKPDLVRKSAMGLDFNHTGNFPGLRSDQMEQDYVDYVKEKIERALNRKIKKWIGSSSAFQLCTDDVETWLHFDASEWAGVLYLTPDAPIRAGTALFRHIPSKQYDGALAPKDIDVKKTEDWEAIALIGNIYNRMVLYRGRIFHRSLMAGFGHDKETARLTQVFFFNLEHE